jgi:hypothetical protein
MFGVEESAKAKVFADFECPPRADCRANCFILTWRSRAFTVAVKAKDRNAKVRADNQVRASNAAKAVVFFPLFG